MVSGVWFKNIISGKKVEAVGSQKLKKKSSSDKPNGYKKVLSVTGGPAFANNAERNNVQIGVSVENAAATRIQTTYRAYMAKKTYRRMRGMVKLKNLVQRDSVKKQASTTLSHLHSWSRIQAQIRARRVHMITESRIKQKKLENQLKLEAKIHDLEVDWSGGSETMDEALARIHQREEAAVRRERAMAYAFSHQWRANSNPNFGSGNYEISKENWGWSWKERWIAARPWESRVPVLPSPPKKAQNHQASKTSKNTSTPTSKATDKNKFASPTGNTARRPRSLSYEVPEKTTVLKTKNSEEAKTKSEQKGS